jgi:hypothetical protein
MKTGQNIWGGVGWGGVGGWGGRNFIKTKLLF